MLFSIAKKITTRYNLCCFFEEIFFKLFKTWKNHQTSHFWTGFMFDPSWHWKSRAKSGELEKGPITLNLPGECAPVLIRFSRVFGRYLEHQVLAAPNQKSCFWFKLRPGRTCSSPCLDSHLPRIEMFTLESPLNEQAILRVANFFNKWWKI